MKKKQVKKPVVSQDDTLRRFVTANMNVVLKEMEVEATASEKAAVVETVLETIGDALEDLVRGTASLVIESMGDDEDDGEDGDD